jgi:NADH dehydrogenase (ubiquinone) flavoprotein 1
LSSLSPLLLTLPLATLARAKAVSAARLPAAASAVPAAARGLATVTDAPKRSHGGLRDQDRIFQNAYLRHDHLLAGAKVRAERGERRACGQRRGEGAQRARRMMGQGRGRAPSAAAHVLAERLPWRRRRARRSLPS